MNLDLLETLVAVAEEGGYSRAARVLAVSQPAVYQRLQRLEALVGVELVQRAGRRIQLTPMGQVVYHHARQIIRQLRLLEDVVAERGATSAAGTLALLIGHSLSEFPAPDICVGFQAENPALVVDLRITARPTFDIDRAIGLGRADVGLHSDPRPVDGVAKEAFYQEEYVAIAWAGHRFEELEVVGPRDFEGEPVVAQRDPTFTNSQSQVEGWFAHGGIEPECSFISNNVITIRELVARRAGIAIIPREHAVQTPGLIQRPLVEPPHRTHFFVTRVTPHEGVAVRALRQYVLSCAWLGSVPRNLGARALATV